MQGPGFDFQHCQKGYHLQMLQDAQEASLTSPGMKPVDLAGFPLRSLMRHANTSSVWDCEHHCSCESCLPQVDSDGSQLLSLCSRPLVLGTFINAMNETKVASHP